MGEIGAAQPTKQFSLYCPTTAQPSVALGELFSSFLLLNFGFLFHLSFQLSVHFYPFLQRHDEISPAVVILPPASWAYFGTAFTATQVAVLFIPPLLLVALQTAISFAVFLPTLALRAWFCPAQSKAAYSKLSWRLVGLGLGLGFFFVALPFTLVAAGETKADVVSASILATTTPIFVLLWHVLLGRTVEGITRWHLLGVVVGVVGAIAVCLRSALGSLPHGSTFDAARLDLVANGLLLLAPASFGFACLYAEHFLRALTTSILRCSNPAGALSSP